MTKPKIETRYVCQSCGATHLKWVGQCPGCSEWNTLTEEVTTRGPAARQRGATSVQFSLLRAATTDLPRYRTGISELDRVLGGGIVPGSVILLGGDPGIGKSTLLLQMAGKLAAAKITCAYISGEESGDQVRMRATRLGLRDSDVMLASSTDAFALAQSLATLKQPAVAIIDSIQTMSMAGLESAPGTVSQIRACANEFIRCAKENGTPVFLVGHVTKEGVIAGPKVLEHAVDTVLYFEGDRDQQYRIVRATKNRFGAADEIGVFAMTDRGLDEVANASELFLSERRGDVAGSAVFSGMEGTRPILVEVQALVAPTVYGSPRRTVVGWDSGRLAMVLAVLEARCGIAFASSDVYLNVVGGFRINEPAADLAVAAALISSQLGRPLPPEIAIFGEIGLGGEIRPVGQAEHRLREAGRLGFTKAIVPGGKARASADGVTLLRQSRLLDLVAFFESHAVQSARPKNADAA